MARGLIYTAIVGDYDKPRKALKEPGVDCLMVTDNPKLKTPGWTRRVLPKAKDPRFLAREVKLWMPVVADPQYDWTLWIDGNMQLKSPISGSVKRWLLEHDFAAFRHPSWKCSYTEIDKCIRLKKDEKGRLLKARQYLAQEGLPKNYGQLASGLLLRRQTDQVKEHARQWWRDARDYTMRDQVTFMLNLWRLKAGIEWIPGSFNDVKWLEFHRGHAVKR